MSKIIIARCEVCNKIVYEWVYKKGDKLDNEDYCIKHR